MIVVEFFLKGVAYLMAFLMLVAGVIISVLYAAEIFIRRKVRKVCGRKRVSV